MITFLFTIPCTRVRINVKVFWIETVYDINWKPRKKDSTLTRWTYFWFQQLVILVFSVVVFFPPSIHKLSNAEKIGKINNCIYNNPFIPKCIVFLFRNSNVDVWRYFSTFLYRKNQVHEASEDDSHSKNATN